MRGDYEACVSKVQGWISALDAKIRTRRDKARTANAKTRPELEQEIKELERQRDDAAESLRDLKSSSLRERPEKIRALDAAYPLDPAAEGEWGDPCCPAPSSDPQDGTIRNPGR
jgi:hypothetical protein